MKARIYLAPPKFYDNWDIVLKFPKRIARDEGYDGVTEVLHYDVYGLQHCHWLEHVNYAMYHGRYIKHDDAPEPIRKRAKLLEEVWNRCCKTEDWTEWNNL